MKNQLTRDQKKSLSRQLDWAQETLASVLKGDKPSIDPHSPQQKWLYDQIAKMYEGHYTATPVTAYFQLPGESLTLQNAKGDTRIHPLSSRFILNERRRLTEEMHSAGVRNFYVMGGEDAPPAEADHYVTTAGGIAALYQTVCALNKNLQSGADNQKFLIIQNRKHFWQPLIQGLHLSQKKVAHACGCTITSNMAPTKDAVLYSGKDVQKEVPRSGNLLSTEMFFGSTQPKKPDETRQILVHDRLNVNLHDAVLPLHWFLSADEVSLTFEGNALEKADALLDRIYNMLGYDEVRRRVTARGYDPDRTTFCVNDTGLAFSEDYSDEPEFTRSRHLRTPGKPWPDVELGTIIDAQGGVRQFMADIARVRSRRGSQEPLRFRDTQVYMTFRLAPCREDVKIQSYFGTATGYVTFSPQPAKDSTLYTEHFCIPDGQPEGPLGKTQAELGPLYLRTDSPQARAVRAMCLDMGVTHDTKPRLKPAIDKRKKLDLLTQNNFLPDVDGPEAPGLKQIINSAGWRRSRRRYPDFETMAQTGDGILLGPHSKTVLANYDQHHARLSLLFCKLGSHKQIIHDTVYGKPYLILNPELNFLSEDAAKQDWSDPALDEKFLRYLKAIDPAENPWGQQIMLFRYYHENAMIKQKEKYIWTQVVNPGLTSQLRNARENFSSHPVTDYAREEYGRDRDDLFEATILGSAGTWNAQYVGTAEKLGDEFIQAGGIHVRTGGGRYGVMGGTARGVFNRWEKNPELKATSHFSAIQMPRTVQFEGLAVNPTTLSASDNIYVAIEPGMDPRMMSLFRKSARDGASIFGAGGLGTLEEWFTRIILSQEGGHRTHGGPTIVINEKPDGNANRMGLYTPLLEVTPPRDLEIANVIVVADASHAIEETLKAKRDGVKEKPTRIVSLAAANGLLPA